MESLKVYVLEVDYVQLEGSVSYQHARTYLALIQGYDS